MVSSLPTQDPVTPEDVQTQPSLGFQLVFGLASLVTGYTITLNTLLLPIQIAIIDPAHQISIFAILVSVGALIAVIVNPLVGALGDRTSSRWGKRRPWIIGSMLMLPLAFFILAKATTIWQLALGTVLTQLALGSLIASLAAIIPEHVPVGRRATVSALFSMATFIGGAIGQILVAQVLKGGIAQDYLVLAVLALILISAFLLVLRERTVAVKDTVSRPLSTLFSGFWVNPFAYRDFGYVWLTRFLFFLSYTTVVNYSIYFIKDVIHYQQVFRGQSLAQGEQTFFTILTLAIVLASVLTGLISDKVQRRKSFAMVASALVGLALLLLAFTTTWLLVAIIAGLLGLGAGMYFTADLALATLVLPKDLDKGKDLGFINTAIFLPMILAPFLASIILNTFHSYTILFLVFAVTAGASSALIQRVKKAS